MYNVVFENSRSFKMLFTGTLTECKQYLRTTNGAYGDDIFVQAVELEEYV